MGGYGSPDGALFHSRDCPDGLIRLSCDEAVRSLEGAMPLHSAAIRRGHRGALQAAHRRGKRGACAGRAGERLQIPTWVIDGWRCARHRGRRAGLSKGTCAGVIGRGKRESRGGGRGYSSSGQGAVLSCRAIFGFLGLLFCRLDRPFVCCVFAASVAVSIDIMMAMPTGSGAMASPSSLPVTPFGAVRR